MYQVKIVLFGIMYWTKAEFKTLKEAELFAKGLKWNWIIFYHDKPVSQK